MQRRPVPAVPLSSPIPGRMFPDPPGRTRPGAIRAMQATVRTWILAGRGLDDVEEELIDPAPFTSEIKAALWLFAWSLLPASHQLAEVEAHIERLLRHEALLRHEPF